jgi:large subunit ribosomal protein L9
MKVFFLEDVLNIAKAGEVKNVADGYARNYLIPKKLATLVNPLVVSSFKAKLREKAVMHAQLEAELSEAANQLEGKEVVLRAKVGTKNRLYGSITNADIASELEKLTGITLDKRKVELHEPIRKLGDYNVNIRLGKDTISTVKVVVSEEEIDLSG